MLISRHQPRLIKSIWFVYFIQLNQIYIIHYNFIFNTNLNAIYLYIYIFINIYQIIKS